MAVTFDQVREAARKLPGVEDSTSWGLPALKVKGKKLLAVHKDADTLVLMVPLPDKDFLLDADPDLFWTTPHYDGSGAILVRLGRLKKAELGELLQRSFAYVTRPRPRAAPGRRRARR